MRAALATAAIGIALLGVAVSGCEGGEPSESDPAGTSAEPGGGSIGANPVPPGAPYDIDGSSWRLLLQADQFQIAEAYAADNPQLCDGAQTSSLVFAVGDAFESGLALESPISGPLAEACETGG